jgi:hypothetical protein
MMAWGEVPSRLGQLISSSPSTLAEVPDLLLASGLVPAER